MMLAPPSPNHLQPSPSPTQTTFSSLRKMPSSIFHRNERTVTSAKGMETINSMVPKEKKKSRMGLGILGWGSSAQDKAQAPPIPAAHDPPPRPIETVRSVGEAFGRVQAERAETMRLGGYASVQRPLPSPMLVNEPLNDVSEAKSKPRLTGVAGIARRASNLSLRPRLNTTTPTSPVDQRRSASDPTAKPVNQRRTSNSSSITSGDSHGTKKAAVKPKGGVAGVWERIAGGKKRSIKEEIEAQMQPPLPQTVKLKDDGVSERTKPKQSFTSSRFSHGNMSTHSGCSSTSSDFTKISTPSTIPVLSISRPSFEGILSRPLLYDEHASYEPISQPEFRTVTGLPVDRHTTLPPPLRARSRGSSSIRPAGGLWDGILGEFDSATEVGFAPSLTIEAAFQKTVPKRKSLTGLFGHFGSPLVAQPLEDVNATTEMPTPARQARDRKVRSEQMGLRDSVKEKLDSSKKQVDIDHVACVTDSLSDLVTRFDLSATPSPAGRNVAHLHKRSPDVPTDVTSSPTPMRRAASFGSSRLLSKKQSGSPLKLFAKNGGLSPFKTAVTKATAFQTQDKPTRVTTGNIFDPANGSLATPTKGHSKAGARVKLSPLFKSGSPLQAASRPDVEAETIGMQRVARANKVVDQLVGMGMTMGPAFAREQEGDGDVDGEFDVPGDLRVILSDSEHSHTDLSLASTPEPTMTMGLPPVPPSDRISPRRPGPSSALPAPPLTALPPSPQLKPRVHAPQLSLDLAFKESVRESFMSDGLASVFSDEFTITGTQRTSFNFTREFADLNGNGQRTSFLEQLEAMGHNPLLPLQAASLTTASVNELEGPDLDRLSPTQSSSSSTPDEPRVNKVSVGALNRNFKFGKASTSPVTETTFASVDTSTNTAVKKISGGSHKSALAQFCGEPLFQKRMSQERTLTSAAESSASIAELPVPTASNGLCPPSKSSSHARDESMFSIASMSSLGTVINTGIAGVFTNVFDAEFARVVREATTHEGTEVSFEMIRHVHQLQQARHGHNRDNFSIDSVASTFSFHAPVSDGQQWRKGHRRSSSIDSRGSFSHTSKADDCGPPVTLFNKSRSNISKSHRQNVSIDSRSSAGSFAHALGCPDWAAHRRNRSSIGSARSSISIARLGRPGLGDRMFSSDREQLPSIMASPDGDSGVNDNVRDSMVSYDSLLDDSSTSRDSIMDGNTGYDSIFDSSVGHVKSSSISSESVFGSASGCDSLKPNAFALKGLRPLSTTSTQSGQAEDAFVNLADLNAKRHSVLQASPTVNRQRVQAPNAYVSSAHHARQSSASEASECSMALGICPQINAFARPRPNGRSQSGHRRRPPTLSLDHSETDVSAFLSPSSSTSSSFGSSIDLGGPAFAVRARPRGAGHMRGVKSKSSAGVNIQATIMEEQSPRSRMIGSVPDLTSDTGGESDASSFMPASSLFRMPTQPYNWGESPSQKNMYALKGWREWEREAGDVYRSSKSSWGDSDESRSAIADFTPPVSPEAIARFITESTETYRPLSQLPLGERMRHRRSSSLTNARALASPYALPLPKMTVLPTRNKTSLPLPTKFERTNSATSSVFSFAYSVEDVAAAVQPPSAVFAKFVLPPAPASPPPVLRDLDPISPFQLPHLQASTTKGKRIPAKQDDNEPKRSRVTSNARRQALGWGRRRTSAGGPAESNALAKSIRSTLAGIGENRASSKANKENEVVMTPPESLKLNRPRPQQTSVSRSQNKTSIRQHTSIRA